jgi:predicted DNA-binding transcriptional regulator YafY
MKDEQKIPFAYDSSAKGYYMTDPSWRFPDMEFSDDEVNMAILGTTLGEVIFPEPLRSQAVRAVDAMVAGSTTDFFGGAMSRSMVCAARLMTEIAPDLFRRLFKNWSHRQSAVLTIREADGTECSVEFEPHILFFHHGTWYVKGYSCAPREVRVFACQRIVRMGECLHRFETDISLVEATRKGDLFSEPKLSGIELHCDAALAAPLLEQQKSRRMKVRAQKDGSLLVDLPPSREGEVLRWILAEGGKVVVLQPKSLRDKVRAAAKAVTAKNA